MSNPLSGFAAGPATRVRRKERAKDDASFIAQVIDQALVAHVAFNTAEGLPQCLPMAFARVGHVLYLHGAVASMLLGNLSNTRCSVTFTLLDGLVFARSAFHHSMNYRCVVAVGAARPVDDLDEKRRALTAIVDHAAKGRSRECIDMTEAEVRSTKVVAVAVEEAVAKHRQGPPVDDADHVALGQHFAGVLPLTLRAGVMERAVPKATLALPPSLDRCAQAFGGQATFERQEGEVLYSSDPSRIDFDWVHQALANESYWARDVERSALETSWRNSLVFGAYSAGRQVACARVLTDFSRMAYLADVFVDTSYRGRGYGGHLLRFVLTHPAIAKCERVVLGTKDAQALYARFGFIQTSSTHMVRMRRD
jgi:uncharacterized protein